jgi:hypothetical protein
MKTFTTFFFFFFSFITINFSFSQSNFDVVKFTDLSREALTNYIKNNSEKEAQRIATLGNNKVQRVNNELKIKLNNKVLTLKNELGEDIAEGLSNSTFHEFLSFFKEDNVIMILTITTGENVKSGLSIEYSIYDGSTGNKLISQQGFAPVISPDGRTFISTQSDDKEVVVTVLHKELERWKYQRINLPVNGSSKVTWESNTSFKVVNFTVKKVNQRWEVL